MVSPHCSSLGLPLPTSLQTIVATAVSRITDEFHGLNQVGWYASAFYMTLASFQSSWGKAYKYLPLKWTFLASVLIFELGSLICGTSNDLISGTLAVDDMESCRDNQHDSYCRASSHRARRGWGARWGLYHSGIHRLFSPTGFLPRSYWSSL